MRRTALFLMLAGFVFVFFSVSLFGIDILIDAVGYLLVWNAIRALQRKESVYGFAATCCLALVVICAIQLITSGIIYTVLLVVRPLAEALLYWQLLLGFARGAQDQKGLRIACLYTMGLCIAASLTQCGLMFVSATLGWAILAVGYVQWTAHIALLALVLYMAIAAKQTE